METFFSEKEAFFIEVTRQTDTIFILMFIGWLGSWEPRELKLLVVTFVLSKWRIIGFKLVYNRW